MGSEIGTLFEMMTIIAVIIAVGALIVLHVLPTGYDPIHDAVSDYGIGRYRGWFWLQVIAGGFASLFLAGALSQLHPVTPTHAVIALVVTTIARFLMPFFATDQGSSRFETVQGTIHMLLAVLAFGGLVWAAMGLWAPLSHYAVFQSAKGILTALSRIMLGCVIAVVLALRVPRLKNVFGLFERLFLLSTYVWFFAITILLGRLR